MPENLLPPNWGSAPFDERDLDAVLAGETADIPDALRPVADALASLRAAPSPSELRGEANAMAQFRELGQGQAARHTEPAPTLPLPAQATGRRRQTARHRGPRLVSRPGRRRNGALLATGAAAAIVAAAVFTGSLPSPISHLARTPSNSPSAAHGTRNSSSPNVETSTASKEATGSPSATRSATSGQSKAETICRTYYGYYMHPPPPSDLRTEMSVEKQLSKLVGNDAPRKMYDYCAQFLTTLPPWTALNKPPAPAHTGTGGSGSNSQGGRSGDAGSNQNGGSGAQQNGGSGAQQNR
ncbi:MAG TPA: hypothetical protein VH589_10370 [Trebonia sp.]